MAVMAAAVGGVSVRRRAVARLAAMSLSRHHDVGSRRSGAERAVGKMEVAAPASA